MSKTLFEELKPKSKEHNWTVSETESVVIVEKTRFTEIDFFTLTLLNDRRHTWIVRPYGDRRVQMVFYK